MAEEDGLQVPAVLLAVAVGVEVDFAHLDANALEVRTGLCKEERFEMRKQRERCSSASCLDSDTSWRAVCMMDGQNT